MVDKASAMRREVIVCDNAEQLADLERRLLAAGLSGTWERVELLPFKEFCQRVRDAFSKPTGMQQAVASNGNQYLMYLNAQQGVP